MKYKNIIWALLGLSGLLLYVSSIQIKEEINKCNITFDDEIIDIGRNIKSNKSIGVFRFKNNNTNAIKINSLITDCHCTTAENTGSSVNSQEYGEIIIEYDNHSLGYFEQTIEVTFNNCDQTFLLLFKGIIIRPEIK